MNATTAAERSVVQYSTQGVAQATGIPVTTILAWERRYGLPRPQRAGSGRRLYSARDVELLQAMRARTAEGVRAELAARELLQTDGAPAPPRRAVLTYLPTEVEELHCLHCGQICGELLSQQTAGRRVVRFDLLPGAVRPTRGPGGRVRCGRCGGDLYREPQERRTLPPLEVAPGPAHRQRGAA